MSPSFFFNLGAQVSGFTNAHLAFALFFMAAVPVAWKTGRWLGNEHESKRPKLIFWSVVGLLAAIILALIALLAMFVTTSLPGQKQGDDISPTKTTERLIKSPRLSVESNGRITFIGNYSRFGGPITLYAKSRQIINLFDHQHTRMLADPVGGDSPRVKLTRIEHFDAEETVNIPIGEIVDNDGNKSLHWTTNAQNQDGIAVSSTSYLVSLICVWADGKEETYPFISIAAGQNLAAGMPQPNPRAPIIIGPQNLEGWLNTN